LKYCLIALGELLGPAACAAGTLVRAHPKAMAVATNELAATFSIFVIRVLGFEGNRLEGRGEACK
jgi:hypothetical protein